MTELTLESPFLDYTFESVPEHWRTIIAAWLVLWGTIAIALLYLYAVVAPNVVGFETTLLVGVGLLVLQTSGGDV